MYYNISPQAKQKIFDMAKEALPLAIAQMEFMIAVFKNFEKRENVTVGKTTVNLPQEFGYHNQGYMAVDPMFQSSSLDFDPKWDPNRWTDVSPYNWYMGEVEVSLEDPDYPI